MIKKDNIKKWRTEQMNKVMIQTPDSYISKYVIRPLKDAGAFDIEYRGIFIGDTIHHIVNFLGKPKELTLSMEHANVFSPAPMVIPSTIYIRGDA